MLTETVKSYLEKYPDLPTLTLAKMIYKENPEITTSIESVRSAIRYNRGALGSKNKDGLIDRRFIRDISHENYNPFRLPISDEKELEPFKIFPQFKKLLVIGDVHVPYHSIQSLTAMIKFVIDYKKIDSILLNGDIVDFHQLSQFVKDPRKRHFPEELELLNEFLDRLDEIFGVKIFYKLGNHEERYENYMRIKAPELVGIEDFELRSLLKFGERNITEIREKRTVQFGKLDILHGHELKGSIIPPVNAARGVFLKTRKPTLVNHFHTKTSHGERLSNDYTECWSNGCMCNLYPEYAVNNKWINGFAIIDKLDEIGNFVVTQYKILKGIVYK